MLHHFLSPQGEILAKALSHLKFRGTEQLLWPSPHLLDRKRIFLGSSSLGQLLTRLSQFAWVLLCLENIFRKKSLSQSNLEGNQFVFQVYLCYNLCGPLSNKALWGFYHYLGLAKFSKVLFFASKAAWILFFSAIRA